MIESCNDPSIVCWNCDGDCFTVKDIQRFEKECLPKYFNHSKFTSFTRQLNFYGFTKLRSDPDLQMSNNCSVRFCHEYFQRDKPELLQYIQRATASHNNREATTPPSPVPGDVRSTSPSNISDASLNDSSQQQQQQQQGATCSVEQIQEMKQQIDTLKNELGQLSTDVTTRLTQAITTMQDDYNRRAQEMEVHYSNLIASLLLAPSSPLTGGVGTRTATVPPTPPFNASPFPRVRQSSE